jgi:LCP family protein required for cell wall assembly
MQSRKKTLQHPEHAGKEFARLYAHVPPDGGVRPARPAKKPQPRWKKIIKRTLLVLVVIALLAGLYVGGKFVYNGVRIFGWDGFLSLFTTRELKGEAEGRVNILIAGNSSDQPGHGGAGLTDSIMLASINTKDKTGYLLSIPRDLYVDIPGHGFAKINEAYTVGERVQFRGPGYPRGGMGLLEKVVSEHFGVPIHYYALVNYAALEEAVNAVGGIEVTIESSDPRGLYDPSPDLATGQPLVDLPNGPVKLDGRQALNLARARGNSFGSYGFARSDFDRTKHQRQIATALAAKASSTGSLTNPVTLGKLFDTLGRNVTTDLSMGEARRLYSLVREIDPSQFKSAGLNDTGDGESLLQSYRTPTGQAALIPRAGLEDYREIREYMRSL